MPNYYRNQDDIISDPEWIATRHRLGPNAYFEVQLVLAELGAAQLGIVQAQLTQETVNIEVGEIGGTYTPGCPTLDQYILIGEKESIKCRDWIKSATPAFDPLTQTFNDLVDYLIRPQEVFLVTTEKGISITVSSTHRILLNPFDLLGTFLRDLTVGDEILTYNEGFAFIDKISSIDSLGLQDTLRISLNKVYIYVSGNDPNKGVFAHNRKPQIDEF